MDRHPRRTLWLVTLLAFAALAPGARAADTDCPGAAGPCPFQGVSLLAPPSPDSVDRPVDAAINPATHDIYVSDRFGYDVKQYASDGTFIRRFGSRGHHPGQLDQPSGIAIDSDGSVWVADSNNNRVVKFDAQGNILAVFGGSQGSADNQLKLPEAIAIGPDGHLWIADTVNNRVVELAADGTFIRKFGSSASGPFGPASGTAPGEFNHPTGIAVAANGDVWVADWLNNRLQRLPSGTTTWETYGANGGLPSGGFVPSGSGPGEFFMPRDVAVAGGILYATDLNHTQRLSSGVWTELSALPGDGLGVADNRAVIVDGDERTVTVLNQADGTPVALAHAIEPPATELESPQAVATDGSGHLYVADTDRDRIVKLDATTGNFMGAFGGPGNGDGQLNGPWGVATLGSHVFVADTSNSRIQEFDENGAFVAKYGQQGSFGPAGSFDSPHGLAVAPDGSLVVADTGNNRIQRSNAARTSWTVIGGRSDSNQGTAVGEFHFPNDVAVSAAGDVWVTDGANHRIQKLPNGSSTWSAFGGTSSGFGDGQFSNPRGLDLTPDGAHVVVADTNNARVQRLSASTGAFDTKWGTSGDIGGCPGEFNSPWGMAVDPDGNVLVSDDIGRRITRFRFNGATSLSVCDHTDPALSPASPANDAAVSSTPDFTVHGGTAAGDDDEVLVRIYRKTGIREEVVRSLSSTSQSGGTWTVTWAGPPLDDGNYTWDAQQSDAGGNLAVTGRRGFTVGTPAGPELALTHLNNGVAVSGNAPGANPVIDDDTPTFSGTAENGAGDATAVTVRLLRYTGTEFVTYSDTTVQRDPDGEWHATFDVPLQPNTFAVRVSQATDHGHVVAADWWLQVTALTVAELNTGVPVSGLSPGPNPVLYDHTPTFSGVALVIPGAATQVTVHLDRWNGSTWVADVHTFTTAANANGLWTATAPAMIDETWQVRVTQQTPGGLRESRPWWFQLKTDPALAITHLDEGVPVSGNPPGANPLFFNASPVIKGTASVTGSSQVTVHYDRNSTSGFVNDVVVKTVARDPNTGAWQATASLTPETYRVRVTQDGQESASWFFQIKADPPLAVTQLDTGVGTSGNPLFYHRNPAIKGTASIKPGVTDEVVIHLDQNSPTGFKNDYLIARVKRDANGSWQAPNLGLPDETYRVRVTQGSASSDSHLFQIKRSPDLAITQLADGVPVSGSAPGPNPVITDSTPTIKGTAGIRPDQPANLVLHFDRYDGAKFVPDARTMAVTRDGNGNWSATPSTPLPIETYQVRVTQGSAASANWWFHYARADLAPTVTIRRPLPGTQGDYRHNDVIAADFSCNDDVQVASCTGSGSLIDTSTVGNHSYKVTARDNTGKVTESKVDYVVKARRAREGIVVQGVEVSQGVQSANMVNLDSYKNHPGISFQTQAGEYNGVNLVRSKRALARVYVSKDASVRKDGLTVRLYVFSGGAKKTFRGMLTPTMPWDSGVIDVSDKPIADKRRQALGAYAFMIPGNMLTDRTDLVAVAVPDSIPDPMQCGECSVANGFAVTDIVPLLSHGWKFEFWRFGDDQPSVVDDVVGALEIMPVAENKVVIPGEYTAQFPVESDWEKAFEMLREYDVERGGDAPYDYAVGVAAPDVRNANSGTVRMQKSCYGFLNLKCQHHPVALLSQDNSRAGAALHELSHGLARNHAGCGDTGDKVGVDLDEWLPDKKGYLQGFGADLDDFEGGTYTIKDGLSPLLKGAKRQYDVMSYCSPGNERNWTSPAGWESMLYYLRQNSKRAARLRSARQAPAQPTLAVNALLDGSNVTITGVSPGPAVMGASDSPVRAIARNAAGTVLADVPMAIDPIESPHSAPSSAAALSAGIPAAATTVDITFGGAVLATRSRSARPPAIAVTSPAPGAVVGKADNVLVGWQAGDADGDAVEVRVEYSRDGGATWGLITASQTGASASLDRGLFGRSSQARVRLTANDGWNETSVVSEVFRSLGTPPATVITSPRSGVRIGSDNVLGLTGQGTDDAHAQLPAKALTWFDGKRRLGRGAEINVRGLSPGIHRIRLVGRDRFGRTGSTTVLVRVSGAAPSFLSLKAPKRIARRARRVRLRVAATAKAVLKAGGRRYRVGLKPRTIRVRVKRGKGDAALTLVLKAGGKRTRTQLIIRR